MKWAGQVLERTWWDAYFKLEQYLVGSTWLFQTHEDTRSEKHGYWGRGECPIKEPNKRAESHSTTAILTSKQFPVDSARKLVSTHAGKQSVGIFWDVFRPQTFKVLKLYCFYPGIARHWEYSRSALMSTKSDCWRGQIDGRIPKRRSSERAADGNLRDRCQNPTRDQRDAELCHWGRRRRSLSLNGSSRRGMCLGETLKL